MDVISTDEVSLRHRETLVDGSDRYEEVIENGSEYVVILERFSDEMSFVSIWKARKDDFDGGFNRQYSTGEDPEKAVDLFDEFSDGVFPDGVE